MTGDVFFWYLVYSVWVARLLGSCVLVGSLAKLIFSFSTKSVLAPCRWLMLSLAKWSHQWLLSWLLKSIAIPNFFMVSVPRMRSCCSLLFLSYLTTLGSKKVHFVIRVVKKVQLLLSLTLSLEDPIQSIPQLWNQAFLIENSMGLSLFTKSRSPLGPWSNRIHTICF